MDYCGFLVILIVLLINILIVNYVRKLEQVTCECSEEWKRDYIKIYSLIIMFNSSDSLPIRNRLSLYLLE